MMHYIWQVVKSVERIDSRWWTPLFIAAFLVGLLCLRGMGSRAGH